MKPLLVIDGDSLAHRAYHALPKTIKRADGKPSGAIVGFANFLVRLWEASSRGASSWVGTRWRSRRTGTRRTSRTRAAASSTPRCSSSCRCCPSSSQALGFTAAKAPGYEADDFLAAAVAAARKKRWPALVVTSDRDSFQLAASR